MRIRTVLATLAATAVAAVTLPMAATAAPGNTVVFGDSLPANPTAGDWLTAKGAPVPGGRVNEMGCGTDFLFSGAVAPATAPRSPTTPARAPRSAPVASA
nr:hypothetical protein [Corynebacterium xerosis]